MLKINFAGKTELQTIKGIGLVVAENIVKYREMAGNITSNEDFRDIPHLNLDHNAIASIDFEENPAFDYNFNRTTEEEKDDTEILNDDSEKETEKIGEASGMTSEKITAASGMAAVSTSSEVFMGQIQSIIYSKNKEATNKFASQGAKPKSKSFVLPPSLRDSYNNDRAALPITMNSGVNTTASIVSSGAPHPTSVMPPMSQVAGVPYSPLYTPCNWMPSSWGAMQNFTPVPYPMQMSPGWNMWGQFPPQYGMMSSSVPGPQGSYIPPMVPTSSMIGQGAVPSMLTGGCIPPMTQIKSEPCNVIGTSQASNVTTSLGVQGASKFIPPTQQQWQFFQQQQLQQQPHLVQQLQQNQQRVPQPQHAPLPQQVPQPQHAPLPQQVPPLQRRRYHNKYLHCNH